MSHSLSELQVLRTVLGQLNAELPAASAGYPGRTVYVKRKGDFHERLDLEITSRQGKARILVSNQIKIGKSSELCHLFFTKRKEMPDHFWIFCDLEKEEHPERCGSTGVFLALFRDCWRAVSTFYKQKPGDLIQSRDEILARLIEWLNGEYSGDREKVLFSFGGMKYPVFLQGDNNDKALWLILGKAAQHETMAHPSNRIGSAPDSLINLLNKLLTWVRENRNGRAPVIFIDHADKIRDPRAAEDVLIKAVPHWNRINASIIMTAPFENTIGDLRYSVESKWGPPMMLYPLDIPNTESGKLPEIYREIVKNAQLTNLIEEKSLRLLAYYSGGILRQFIQFLIQASKEAHLAGHQKIKPADAYEVIDAAKRAYYDYSPEAYELLDNILQTGTGLSKAATLLRSPIGLLVRKPENEMQNLKIHPLALSGLEQYRRKRGENR